MSLLLAVLVVVVFAAGMEWLRLPERAREVGHRGWESIATLRDPELDDRAKERALRRQSARLFQLLGFLVGGGLLALGLPLLGVWLLHQVGLASFEGVLAVLWRGDFLLAATLVGCLTYLVFRRLRRP